VKGERARRRAEREAAAQARREAAEAAAARRARRRRRVQRLRTVLVPAPVRRRGRGRWVMRRSRGERAVVAAGLALVAVLVWFLFDSWPVRIAVVVLTVVALPAVLTIAFGRQGSR
jgi:Flp pilus assembly protein TadB